MTQEEKDLVLKDIGARLYYGVKISVPVVEKNMIFTVIGISESWLLVKNDRGSIFNVNISLEFKPYYRPMSSMTEDELQRYHELCDVDEGVGVGSSIEIIAVHNTSESLDYLNSIHVDYRGLIPKGLALEAPEGMYNI